MIHLSLIKSITSPINCFFYYNKQKFYSIFFCFVFCLGNFYAFSCAIKPLSSLLFHIKEWKEQLELNKSLDLVEDIFFSENDVETLWLKVLTNTDSLSEAEKSFLAQAYENYQQVSHFTTDQNKKIQLLTVVYQIIDQLWQNALEAFERSDSFNHTLSNAQTKSQKIHRYLEPYLIPSSHPLKKVLDDLFSKQHITESEQTFEAAGFITIANQPRSFIRVASHPLLPNHLVKVYLDTVTRKKQNKESWEWLILRCEGAKKIRQILRKYAIKHFTVPSKYIYAIQHPIDINFALTTPYHPALLLVTDMQLTSRAQNHHAWYTYVTKKHLEELYTIISHSRGSSYGPRNICYTIHDVFAFIDTEYEALQRGPDYKSIRSYLNPTMRKAWDRLVKKG